MHFFFLLNGCMTNRAAFSTVAVTVLENEENQAILDGRLGFLDVMQVVSVAVLTALPALSTCILYARLDKCLDSIAMITCLEQHRSCSLRGIFQQWAAARTTIDKPLYMHGVHLVTCKAS